MQNDTEATFVEDFCQRGPDYVIKGEGLYKAYKRWCDENGYKTKNITQVAKDWERLGFYKVKSNGSSLWHGLRIHPDNQPALFS